MKIKKISSDHNILESGSVITYSDSNNLLFSIQMDESFGFELDFRFDSIKDEGRQLKKTVTNNTITLTCVNFDNTLGTGTKGPIELATFNGKKIYINFWVTALGENALKMVYYTIYSEK